MKATKTTRAQRDAEILANAEQTAQAFAELAGAVERKMLAVMRMPARPGLDDAARRRALASIEAGALTTGPRGEPWLAQAHHRSELVRLYLNGLFLPEGDQSAADKIGAKLWRREPEHVVAHSARTAEALAHVMAGVVAELSRGDTRRAA
ncbi:hypothetical protein A2cp1_2129 [Anaeromyxobacter dehalogenans 2CP-1]|uniref:Uncharacterized protein n=1 Tax=Anaeromyxobacter dehalogenans (strain ATCC BAA-258 / DSM 21875 / 2CP-1) TaxID=455488 RepID=B8J963_ANAD2|nr:hypothetical protein [Anaeromyxobacter dehalogenans]ACL65469.1 hypothetical protein A2cp1_2129 [Anaeromyxobacter dehalogenans 2CP-1]